jgi:serine/threonine-protein kinase
MTRTCLLCTLALLAAALPARADKDSASLAAAARDVLKKNCARCHADGQSEGGFGFALDAKRLVEGKKVKPGDASKSRLVKRVESGEMPPEDEKPRPSAEDIAALKAWIDAGAPAFSEETATRQQADEKANASDKEPPATGRANVSDQATPPAEKERSTAGRANVPEREAPTEREPSAAGPTTGSTNAAPAAGRAFLSEKEILAAIRGHLRGLPVEDQPFQRYFTLSHLHNNPSVRDEDLRWQRAALAKAVNSLSWKPRVVVPAAVDKEQTLFAIDLRDLDWDRRRVWEEVSRRYPYGLTFDGRRDEEVRSAALEVYRLTGSDLPALRADWFVATVTRPPLYHTILDLPDNADKLEKLLRVDVAENFRRDKLARAGFAKSGVSSQNRLIERHEAAYGAYWKSFDFRTNDGTSNLFRFPLGPAVKDNQFTDQAFAHAGGELIFHLPNGLQGYLLVDAKGKRIDEGPADIVSDTNKTSGTVAIVNGLSCMGCHKHGMIRDGFRDELRDGAGVSGAARTKLLRLHPKPDQFAALMKEDEDRFVAALDRSTGTFLKLGADRGKDIRDFTDEPISRVVRAYNRDLTLPEVAAELGLPDAKRLASAVEDNDRLRQIGLAPLTHGGVVKRDAWATLKQRMSPFQRAALELDRGSPHLPF